MYHRAIRTLGARQGAAAAAAGGITNDDRDLAILGGQIGIAMVQDLKEQAGAALPLLRRAVALSRDGPDPDLLYFLAYSLGRTGKREEAARLLKRVVELDPGNADAKTVLKAMGLRVE